MLRISLSADESWLVDPDRLTPRAAAIARLWSANRLHSPCPLILQSVHTVAEMGADADEIALWWRGDGSRRHRMVLEYAGLLPGRHLADPHERMEWIAQQLPVGYVPVGGGDQWGGVALDTATLEADADLITATQVRDLLRRLGRPLTEGTLRNYTSKGGRAPGGWPDPARYVGRTPLWSRRDVEEYAGVPK